MKKEREMKGESVGGNVMERMSEEGIRAEAGRGQRALEREKALFRAKHVLPKGK